MELALNVIGRMASYDQQWKSVCFQAGSKTRAGDFRDWVISQ